MPFKKATLCFPFLVLLVTVCRVPISRAQELALTDLVNYAQQELDDQGFSLHLFLQGDPGLSESLVLQFQRYNKAGLTVGSIEDVVGVIKTKPNSKETELVFRVDPTEITDDTFSFTYWLSTQNARASVPMNVRLKNWSATILDKESLERENNDLRSLNSALRGQLESSQTQYQSCLQAITNTSLPHQLSIGEPWVSENGATLPFNINESIFVRVKAVVYDQANRPITGPIEQTLSSMGKSVPIRGLEPGADYRVCAEVWFRDPTRAEGGRWDWKNEWGSKCREFKTPETGQRPKIKNPEIRQSVPGMVSISALLDQNVAYQIEYGRMDENTTRLAELRRIGRIELDEFNRPGAGSTSANRNEILDKSFEVDATCQRQKCDYGVRLVVVNDHGQRAEYPPTEGGRSVFFRLRASVAPPPIGFDMSRPIEISLSPSGLVAGWHTTRSGGKGFAKVLMSDGDKLEELADPLIFEAKEAGDSTALNVKVGPGVLAGLISDQLASTASQNSTSPVIKLVTLDEGDDSGKPPQSETLFLKLSLGWPDKDDLEYAVQEGWIKGKAVNGLLQEIEKGRSSADRSKKYKNWLNVGEKLCMVLPAFL